nr:glycine-rich RNA-binding protein RZ1A-like [Arachis hypogaea]
MDETWASLLADDLRKVATSVMSSSNGREYNDQAQGLFTTRGRTNERGKGNKREKSRPKSRPHTERTCFKCGEAGHFKANCPNKKITFKKQNNDNPKEKQEASYVSNDEKDCYSITE